MPLCRLAMLVVGLTGFTLAGCSGGESVGSATPSDDSGRLQGELTITGSSTVAPLVAEMARRFERLHPEVRIEVAAGGSARGLADARKGLSDIGMVSRSVKPDGLQVVTIARDGVCPIVHHENPIDSLSDGQLAGIYTGRLSNWKQVGGRDAPITVVNKSEGRATLEVFLRYTGLTNRDIEADVIIGHNEQAIKTVAGNPNAIAYVSIGTAETDREAGVPIKLVPLRGVEASVENVSRGRFPLSRQLNLVTAPKPGSLTRAFLEFAQSSRVHDLIEELTFAPLES